MSAAVRSAAFKLRRAYAHRYGVALCDVHERFIYDPTKQGEEAEVWCPSRPELPRWQTGEIR